MVECVEQMVYKGYERVTNGRCVQVGWGYWVSPGRGLWDGVVCWYGMLETGFELAYGVGGKFDAHEGRDLLWLGLGGSWNGLGSCR